MRERDRNCFSDHLVADQFWCLDELSEAMNSVIRATNAELESELGFFSTAADIIDVDQDILAFRIQFRRFHNGGGRQTAEEQKRASDDHFHSKPRGKWNNASYLIRSWGQKTLRGIRLFSRLAGLISYKYDFEMADLLGTGYRALLAEDNMINREILQQQLLNLGFMVEAVTNGKEAVQATEKSTFDIILLDCEMPEMDGFQATKAIRKNGKDIPILALTGHSSEDIRLLALRAGMNEFVTKPLETEALAEAVRPWLKSKS